MRSWLFALILLGCSSEPATRMTKRTARRTAARPGACELRPPEVAATALRTRTGRLVTREEIADVTAFLRR
jgi:hypothetical protein